MTAKARELWDLYAPKMVVQGAFDPAWVPGLQALCEFESELIRDEREYERSIRRAKRDAKAVKCAWEKSRDDRLEKRELLARRRTLAQMKHQFILTPQSDVRLSGSEAGGMGVPSGPVVQQQQSGSGIYDPFEAVQ